MTFSPLITCLILLYGFLTLYFLILTLNQLIFTVVYLLKKNKTIRDEQQYIQDYYKTHSLDSLPSVLIQLPIYNEKYVIERLLAAIVQLEYPAEKIQIQVLDDSTDDSTEKVAQAVAHYAQQGINIQHIHRSNRTGFKAGALKNGMEQNETEFIAIFDADFVPSSSFLLQTIPFFAQSDVAFVQTPWSYLNRGQSWLTRVQAVFHDIDQYITKMARGTLGFLLGFNGTSGVWRRAAIMDAGGWQGDTLTEDLDLSFRAQMKGWKGKCLLSLASPSELPAEFPELKNQQYRWGKGFTQNGLLLTPKLLKSSLPWWKKLEAIHQLWMYFCYPLSLCLIIVSPVLFLLLQKNTTFTDLGYCCLWGICLISVLTQQVMAYLAYRQTQADPQFFTKTMPYLFVLGAGLTVNNTRAVLSALWRHESEFVRTPKFGNQDSASLATHAATAKSRKASLLIVFELIIGVYLAIIAAISWRAGLFLSIIFPLIYAVGLMSAAWFTYAHQAPKLFAKAVGRYSK